MSEEKYSIDSSLLDEDITATATSDISGLSEDKRKILDAAKEQALVKVAAFDGKFQDPYPSPFLNLSDTQIPRTTIEIFRWCKYFYMFDPLISGAINALATFPVTELHLEDKSSKEDEDDSPTLKTYKRVIFKNINIYKLLIEIGIDYFLYGNCFVFGEMWDNPVTGEKEWKSMTRLDPSKMIIDYNPATHNIKYKWQVPLRIQEIVKKKQPKAEYDKIPDIIKDAVKKKQAIVLNSENIYHFSRATDSMGDNSVWGTPIVANVLKLLMYRNILRQAQEAIAREHIVPMRIYYIDKTETYNPDADWSGVASAFAQELNKSVRDPNHKVVSPVPINVINVGGEGKSLLLAPEIQQVQEEILAGMNVPREFIFGGVSYSGSSISLKILENQFITYRLLHKDFIDNFVIKGMAKARKEWVSEDDDDALISSKFQDLKMQDDVQQKQLIIQLNGVGKVSNDYMWKTIGIEPEKMRESLEKEALAAVELKTKVTLAETDAQLLIQKKQIEVQMQLQLYQAQLQKEAGQKFPDLMQPMMDPNMNANADIGAGGAAPNQGGVPAITGGAQQPVTPPVAAPQPAKSEQTSQTSTKKVENPSSNNEADAEAQKVALQLIKMPEKYRQQVMSTLPQSAQQKVTQALSNLEGAMKMNEKTKTDMRPLPQQKPPRRDSLK
jgi:ribosomal protein S13